MLSVWHDTGRADLESHLSVHGPLPWPRRADDGWARSLVEDLRVAGLTGRGGAGFPTARKLESVRTGHRRPLLAVNAMEGEPASKKDRALLSAAPHLVLDGAEIVAAAIGSREIALCVADDQDESARHVKAALAERARAGMNHVPVQLLRPPGSYVGGEESALVAWLDGRPALPQFRASKGVPLTIKRRPVLVQSAETLAHVALIARRGPKWFRGVGRPDAPGTCLVTVSGPLANPGVYEVELGTPLTTILERAGIRETHCRRARGRLRRLLAPRRRARHPLRAGSPRRGGKRRGGRGARRHRGLVVRRCRDGPGGHLYGQRERGTVWSMSLRARRHCAGSHPTGPW